MNKYINNVTFQKQGFWKKRSLGQNFLINPHIIDKVITAAEISKNDTILEVGPGTGNLTKKIAEKANKVIAVEKDHRLIESLKENFKSSSRVEIIRGDILKLRIRNLGLGSRSLASGEIADGYKIVANIPYYITSNLLRTIFESADWQMTRPKLIVLMVQKEVAQRIMAKPPDMNLLALSVQYYSEPEVIGYISKNNFRPVPKVDSAIIRLAPRTEVEPQRFPGVRPRKNQELFELIRVGFSEKRKQLAPILSKKLKIEKEKILELFNQTGVEITARAENLSLEQWKLLEQSLGTYGD